MCMLLFEFCFHEEMSVHTEHRDHLYGSMIAGVHIFKSRLVVQLPISASVVAAKSCSSLGAYISHHLNS